MCIPKMQQKIEGTHGDENISDRNKWLHVITFTNISNSAEELLKFKNHSAINVYPLNILFHMEFHISG